MTAMAAMTYNKVLVLIASRIQGKTRKTVVMIRKRRTYFAHRAHIRKAKVPLISLCEKSHRSRLSERRLCSTRAEN